MKNRASAEKEQRERKRERERQRETDKEEKTRVRANNGIVYARTRVRREFCERMNETGDYRRERVWPFVSGSRYATNVGENVDYLRPDTAVL